MKLKYIILSVLLCSTAFGYGQTEPDLLADLEKIAPDKPQPVIATFKSTRIINGHSNETVAAKP
jgi:hypothetical protein